MGIETLGYKLTFRTLTGRTTKGQRSYVAEFDTDPGLWRPAESDEEVETIITAAQLDADSADTIRRAAESGETVTVFTNVPFDRLHAGFFLRSGR